MSQLLTQLESHHELSIVNDETIPDDILPGKTFVKPTVSLTKNSVGPSLSLGIEFPLSFPRRVFPEDMSLGNTIPGDMSPTKISKCRRGMQAML
nr:hypothetical protein [Tanacetum cinerariifolium]